MTLSFWLMYPVSFLLRLLICLALRHSVRRVSGRGGDLTLVYSYSIYVFAVHFNSLLLVYVAILGVSFYTLVSSVMHLHMDSFKQSLATTTKARSVRVSLVLAYSFYKK